MTRQAPASGQVSVPDHSTSVGTRSMFAVGASISTPASPWPRKAAGHVSDITENLLRELVLPTGLVDVKVAALDEDWSGLKFVWRKENR